MSCWRFPELGKPVIYKAVKIAWLLEREIHVLVIMVTSWSLSLVSFLFQIEKLSQESIQHPTPLLKLLFAWSKNSRFFPLLSRKPVEKPDLSIMSCVFACLQVPSVSEDVVAMVMEMADNLLATSQAETGDKKSDLLECGSELTWVNQLQLYLVTVYMLRVTQRRTTCKLL